MNISKTNFSPLTFSGKSRHKAELKNQYTTQPAPKETPNLKKPLIKNAKQKAAAVLLALSCMASIGGCANKTTETLNTPQAALTDVQTEGLLNLNEETRKTNPMLALGADLYNELTLNPETDPVQYIKNYLKEQNITDITVAKLDREKFKGAEGKFDAFYDENMDYCGGRLCLNDPPEGDDDKEKLIYCMSIAHELQHLKDTIDYSWLNEAKNLPQIQDPSEVSAINHYTSLFQETTRKNLQFKPIVYLLKTSTGALDDPFDVKTDKDTALKINGELDKYGFFFAQPYSKSLDNLIEATFADQGGYDSYCENVLNYIFDRFFEDSNFPSSLKNKDGVELFKSYFCYLLDFEAKAYEICSQMMKLYDGIDLSKQTLNDLTPVSYEKLKNKIANFEYSGIN